MKTAFTCCAVVSLLASMAWAQQPPIVDRAEFISDPEISYASLSPDSQYMTFLKLYKDVRNVWIKKRSEPFEKARPLTAEMRPIRAHRWSRDSKYVLYERDTGGDENYHIYVVDPKAPGHPVPAARDLTPFEKVRAFIVAAPIKTPNEIVVGINDRDPKLHDVYRINLQGKQAEYVCAPDEGHGFDGRENRIAMFVAMERFFAKHLGGRLQQDVPEAIQKRLDAITVNVNDVALAPATEGKKAASHGTTAP